MIARKNVNEPMWLDVATYTQLPQEIKRLEEIAYNLWWVWTPSAKELFNEISPELWEETEGNPILLLKLLPEARIAELLKDKGFLSRLDAVYADWQSYMAEPANNDRPSVAYFSMEYGLTNVLKIYSGGLGVLAGDYLKEASDSNVRLTAVGFLYRYGYFTQSLSQSGEQIANYEAQDFGKLPLKQVLSDNGEPLILDVQYNGYVVYSHVWSVQVGRIVLYLLDTDLELNDEWNRAITHKLYGGDWENRLKQEYLLGIGGMQLLNKLGIQKDVYHMNEGHAAFMNVQRLLDYVEGKSLTFDVALELTRASSLYTVHTPVPAGHDYFTEELMGKYLGHIPSRLGISWSEFMDMGREHGEADEKFSMSTFALNTCQEANGVSKLHGKVSQEMFAPLWPGFFPQELYVGYVTNGVHLPTWATKDWQELYKEVFGENYKVDQTKEAVWSKIQEVSDQRLWDIHSKQKHNLIQYIRGKYRERWLSNSNDSSRTREIINSINPDALLIGFGRRFATYKRAHLIFTDLERLDRIVNNPERPVQFLFTGKAHPADGGGQGLIKHILEISRLPQFLGKIIFLENYDMRLAEKLISGVDVWMNTPTRPLEASGTSGEKAEMNGVLNLSVLDGWWYEGYRPNAGWALTDKRTFTDQSMQDKLDADTIYDLIENDIAPLYFDKKGGNNYSEGWVAMMKNSLNYIAPHYTMRRMLDDYYERFYTKLALRSKALHAEEYTRAKELALWKMSVANAWDGLEVTSVSHDLQPENISDTEQKIELSLSKGELSADLIVELVVAKEGKDGKLSLVDVWELDKIATQGQIEHYALEYKPQGTGWYKYAIRISPTHEALPHRQDFAYVRWVSLG